MLNKIAIGYTQSTTFMSTAFCIDLYFCCFNEIFCNVKEIIATNRKATKLFVIHFPNFVCMAFHGSPLWLRIIF